MDHYIQVKRKLSPLNSQRKVTRGNVSIAAIEMPINTNRFEIIADASGAEKAESTEVEKRKPKTPTIYFRKTRKNAIVEYLDY